MANTAESMTSAALGALVNGDEENFLVVSRPGGIEAQEAQGQSDFVESASLPIDTGRYTREQFESMGIVFGDDVDDLFVSVVLPDGWEVVPTDHSMQSHLVDEKGRERADIFYKAAFYDRSAHIRLNKRYHSTTLPLLGWDGLKHDEGAVNDWVGRVFDAGEVVFETAPVAITEGPRDWNNDPEGKLAKEAEAWMVERYPDYDNPLAYWDDSTREDS